MIKADFVNSVFGAVVIRIAEWGGVGHHNSGVALPPKRLVVRPVDAWDNFRDCSTLRWELAVFAERGDNFMQKFAVGEVADEADEVSSRRVEETKRWRVFLSFGLISVVANSLKAEHSDDVLIFFSAAFGVKHTSHLAGLEEWRLFVGKEDEAQSFVDFFAGESVCEGKCCCDG